MTARRFILRRYEDHSGLSGAGDVAEGVVFSLTAHEQAQGITDGAATVRWLTEWPTSVVFHDRGLASAVHLHGHNGATRLIFLDPPDDGSVGYAYGDYQGAMTDLDVLLGLAKDVTTAVEHGAPALPAIERLAAHINRNYPGRRP